MKENVQLLQDINDLKKKQHELEIGIAEIDRMKKQLYNDAQAQNLVRVQLDVLENIRQM